MAFLYWISPGLHLLNTNTERWHQLQNKLLGMTCWKRNQNVSRHLAACQLPQLDSVEVQCFKGFTRIKLSNTADWYMWNITDILPDESCVDMTYPDNMLADLEGLTVTLTNMLSNSKSILHSISEDRSSGRSSTPNVEGLPDLADLPDLVMPDVDSYTGNDTVLYTTYWRNCTVPMLSDVFNNLEILNTPLILVIRLLQDNNIFKKLTSGIMDSLTGFQDNLVQSWWPAFPTGVAGHVGGTSV